MTSIAAPIVGLSATEAAWDQVVLIWPEITDAKDYKIYWDKGSEDNLNLLKSLSATTNGLTRYVVNNQTSYGILGSENVKLHGGKFKFRVSYMSIKTGKESAISDVLSVTVPKK
jgi:hypothetical protein